MSSNCQQTRLDVAKSDVVQLCVATAAAGRNMCLEMLRALPIQAGKAVHVTVQWQ